VIKKITAIKVLENYRVWLRFNDGVEGEADFSGKPRTGVFACWNHYENFRQARVGEGGELLWNDQLDFCPDSLWLQVTGENPEALQAQNSELTYA
jgi:hypothetical protein